MEAWKRGIGLIASIAILQAGIGVSQIVEGGTAEIKAQTQGEILAEQKAKGAKKLLGRQTMQFLKSGVGLSGTPSTILDETVQFANEDINAIRDHYKDIGKNAKRKSVFQGISTLAQAGQTALTSFTALKTMQAAKTVDSTNLFDPRLSGGFDTSLDFDVSKFTFGRV